MELSGITQSLPFVFRFPDREDGGSTPPAAHDTVRVSASPLLSAEEADAVFNETLDMIASDNIAALSAHSGLVPERVFALLGL